MPIGEFDLTHSLSEFTQHWTIGGGTYSADTAIAVPLLKVVQLIM